jgi:hypothetical protein
MRVGGQRHSPAALHPGRAPYPLEESGWTTEPVETSLGDEKIPCPHWDLNPDFPASTEILHRPHCNICNDPTAPQYYVKLTFPTLFSVS